jgi:transposase
MRGDSHVAFCEKPQGRFLRLTRLAMILEMYRVEYRAAEADILRTPDHLAMRRKVTRPIIDRIKFWMEAQKQGNHVPKSPLMKAIGYTERAWDSLVVCLDDVNVYLDNNVSERALRQIAIGRKNYMFVGNEAAGRNLAINQTVISSCIMADVNPQEYLTDVLIRIQSHPAKLKHQLLPANWKILFSKSK